MVTAFAPADADALVSALPLAGKLKDKPLVRGALIVTRLSRPKETMSSLKMQERHRRAHAQQHGLEVLGVYHDVKSGLLPGAERDGYRQAMRRARQRLCSHLLVYDFDRLGREGVATLADYEELERLGIAVHDSLTGFIDHETAARKAVEAHNEVRKTSRRVMDNMLERHMNKEDFRSPRRPPFGYWTNPATGEREPDPRWIIDGEHVVTTLFTRFDAGASKASLRAWFNATTGRQARAWSITNLLKNEYYAGVDVYNRRSCSKIRGTYAKPPEEWSTRLHDHPLVDLALFKRVQARLEAYKGQGRSPAGAAPAAYALHGLVRCAACTYTQHGQTRHVSLRGQTHGVPKRVSAQCPVCLRSRVYGRVEEAVLRALAAIPVGADAIAALGQPAPGAEGDPAKRLDALTQRIEKVRARRGRLINRRELDPDDPDYLGADDYTLAMADNRRELDELEAQRTALAQGAAEGTSAEAVLEWLATLSSWTEVLDPQQTTPEERRGVYVEAISTVLLDFAASTATVYWLPALARLAGVPSSTLPIARGKLSKKQKQPRVGGTALTPGGS